MNTYNLYFEQKYENYQNQLLVLKYLIYLNRHVFVMHCLYIKGEK